MTFNKIWEEYIAHKRKRVKPSTISVYLNLWNKVRDVFGEIEIASLSTKMVEKWAIDSLSSVSRKTIKDRIIFLNNIIDYYGYEYEVNVTRINPRYIHWPTVNAGRPEPGAVKTLTGQDIQAILIKVSEDPRPSSVLVAIMIASGIRIGEACALTYGDVNLDSGTLEVTDTLERIMLDPGLTDEDFKRMNVKVLHKSRKSALILSTPKCRSSRRSIPLPRELLKVLKGFRSVYPEDYYIGSNSFKPMEPRTLRNYYYRLLDSAGVEGRFNPHSLRHTYATNLITSGVDVKTTAALLGHGDTSTTLEVYSHATPESKKRAMKQTIGRQFRSALGNLK